MLAFWACKLTKRGLRLDSELVYSGDASPTGPASGLGSKAYYDPYANFTDYAMFRVGVGAKF